MFQFGIGALFAIPTTGNLASTPTPQQFGTLQDVSFEISQKLETLMGTGKFPDDTAPSDMKITGKATFGNLQVDLFNQLFFGQSALAVGIAATALNEAHSVPATTTYTVTVTNSTGFTKDFGVIYANGARFERVTTSPTAGQYTVSAGVYTFAVADASAAVLISYEYTPTVNTTGKTLTVTNQLQGFGPVFELYLDQPYQGANGVHLYACRSSKLGLPLKRAGYQVAEFDFEAYANAAGNVIDFFQGSN